MKLDRKQIKQYALRNFQYDTGDRFEAILQAVETWMGRNELEIVKKTPPPETGEAMPARGEPN